MQWKAGYRRTRTDRWFALRVGIAHRHKAVLRGWIRIGIMRMTGNTAETAVIQGGETAGIQVTQAARMIGHS